VTLEPRSWQTSVLLCRLALAPFGHSIKHYVANVLFVQNRQLYQYMFISNLELITRSQMLSTG
jgi:hypothetical protein